MGVSGLQGWLVLSHSQEGLSHSQNSVLGTDLELPDAALGMSGVAFGVATLALLLLISNNTFSTSSSVI